MTYVEGFIVPVPVENRDSYRRHAAAAWPLFAEFGATRLVEAWEDDVSDGKVTDFRRAVEAKAGEKIVFSWIEYPSKEVRDAANAKMMSDPRMRDLGEMPFDGQRMIFSGFAPFLDAGSGSGGYVDGFVAPVPAGKLDAYRAMAKKGSAVFIEHGAIRVVESLGDDLRQGKVTDYARAVKREQEGEDIVFSWIEWPDKDTRVEGWNKAMADPRMQPDPAGMPFDGKRMFWGGFEVLLDSAAGIGLEAAAREPA
ncbi:MAG TPA: DUF1428 domain-containing protein [Allosphingosinicella sp.]|nr:DUF1428 domain-containing protein [Allosphingosinicella sp.]